MTVLILSKFNVAVITKIGNTYVPTRRRRVLMSKVCRIVRSQNLNLKKFNELSKQANLLGRLRKEVWQRFGSISGVGIDFRTLRNRWVKERDFSPLPAKAWKETLKDVLDDISMNLCMSRPQRKKFGKMLGKQKTRRNAKIFLNS